jgi:hypothetical protein
MNETSDLIFKRDTNPVLFFFTYTSNNLNCVFDFKMNNFTHLLFCFTFFSQFCCPNIYFNSNKNIYT